MSWTLTILDLRRKIDVVLGDSPSLRPHMPAVITRAYKDAVERVALETGLPVKVFPAQCPWTIADIIHTNWMPPG